VKPIEKELMPMDLLVTTACDLLAQGRAFVLATIIEQQGSAPRTEGTRMLIANGNEIYGTIGGGLLEAETMRAAARMNAQESAGILKFDLTNQHAAVMEMMCGGRVRVLLDYIPPSDENRMLFNGWRNALALGRKAMLVSTVSMNHTHVERIEHALVSRDNGVLGRLDVSDDVFETLTKSVAQATHVQVHHTEGRLLVADPGQIASILYIFGAGHVARPTAHLAAMVGFGVEVLDDRSEFTAAGRFPEAAAVHTIASFDAAFENLAVSGDTYIIIVTRGHLHDRTVLAQALKTPAKYIGMIGSRRKRDAIYDSLRADGFTDADIARVHSPIGLAIGADTPEEIAVSIVAELVAVRAGKQV
jgi:xanthine dehydrogenase accessory factor